MRRRADAKQAVKIDDGAAAGSDDADLAQRSRPPNAAGLSQSGTDVAERGQIVLAGPIDLAADEDRDGAHRAERDIDFGAQQRPPCRRLHVAGDRAQRAASSSDRRQTADDQPALAVDADSLAVVGRALKLDDNIIANADRVAVTDGTSQPAARTLRDLEQFIAELPQCWVGEPLPKLAFHRRWAVQALQPGAGFGAAQFLFFGRVDAHPRLNGPGRRVPVIGGVTGTVEPAATLAELPLHLLQHTGIDGLPRYGNRCGENRQRRHRAKGQPNRPGHSRSCRRGPVKAFRQPPSQRQRRCLCLAATSQRADGAPGCCVACIKGATSMAVGLEQGAIGMDITVTKRALALRTYRRHHPKANGQSGEH